MSKFFDDTMQGLLEAAAIEYMSIKEPKDKSISDALQIGVDFSPNDADMMMVMRRKGTDTYIVNVLEDDEAVEVYNKLIGNTKDQIIKVKENFVESECKNTTTKALERYKRHHKES